MAYVQITIRNASAMVSYFKSNWLGDVKNKISFTITIFIVFCSYFIRFLFSEPGGDDEFDPSYYDY